MLIKTISSQLTLKCESASKWKLNTPENEQSLQQSQNILYTPKILGHCELTRGK